MATADSVKAKIQSLINKANSKTGRSDKDMTSAVDALVEGYGGGSSGGGVETCTVTIEDPDWTMPMMSFIEFNGENFSISEVVPTDGDTYTVVCKSQFIVDAASGVAVSVSSVDGSSYYDRGDGRIGNSDTTITLAYE